MDISICIVSYNVCNILKQCLNSIHKNSGNFELETIVVDNASKDGSADMIKDEFPNIKLIENDVNRGFAAAVNQGLKESQGDYLFILNPDTEIQAGVLETLTDYLKNNLKCGLVGPKLINKDGSIQNGLRRFPGCLMSLVNCSFLRKIPFLKKGVHQYRMRHADLNQAMDVQQISGAAMMMRRDAFEKIGFLDENFFIYFEEVDYCKRTINLGYDVHYEPSGFILHIGGESAKCKENDISMIRFESMMKYLRKHNNKVKFAFFSLLFKPFYLFSLFIEFLLDMVILPSQKILHFLFPKYTTPKKITDRQKKAKFRWFFLTKKLGFFIFKM